MNKVILKLALMPPLLIVACLLAGGYGMIHDQVTYTISSEYFTKFKFDQFQIPAHLRNRLGAGMVGWAGTWWMGALMGFVLMLLGLKIRGRRAYFITTLKSYGIVATTTLIASVGALTISRYTIHDANVPIDGYLYGASDPISFALVGLIHSAGYIGGLVGGVLAVIFMIRRIRHANKAFQVIGDPRVAST